MIHIRIDNTGRRLLVAAVLTVAACVVAVGAASAATKASTQPITVCVNKADRAVTEPSGGHCNAHREETVRLASAHDVATLANRVAAVEGGLTSQESALNQLRSMLQGELVLTAQSDTQEDFLVAVDGQLLHPTAKVKIHGTDAKDHTTTATVGTVDETGRIHVEPIQLPCGTHNVYFTSVDLNGGAISTIHQLTGPSCP